MNRLCLSAGAALVLSVNSVWAQPYQFEIRGTFAQIEFSVEDSFFGDSSFESDSVSFEGRYFLQPVDHSSGPLAERAFLDKAASVGLAYSQVEPDEGESTDAIGIDARFVTLTDTIFELEYITTDSPDEDDDDVNEYRLGAGKYTDDRTTVLGSFTRDEVDDLTLDVLAVNLRKVEDAGAANASIAYEGSFGFLMASDDNGNDENGFEFIGRFTYYTSEQFGIGGGIGYRDIDVLDVTTFAFEASYFFNEMVSAVAGFERSSTSFDLDTDIIAVGFAARF